MALVLVTGASTGIGFELAKVLAEHGHGLLMVSKDKARLAAAAATLRKTGVPVHTLAIDLAAPDAPARVYTWARKIGAIDILINNAGFGVAGEFARTKPTSEQEMIQVNIDALTGLCKLFLPDMIQRKSGSILNVASVAGFFPGPGMAVYFATKNYVVSFSLALAEEVQHHNVSIGVLCPGWTRTRFAERAGFRDFRWPPATMSSEKVARAAYQGIRKRKRLIIPGLFNKAAFLASQIVPLSMQAPVIWRMRAMK